MAPDVLQLQLPLPQPQPGSERQETLADRLCDLLIRRGRPLEIGHVVAQVLRVRQCPEALQRRLVAEIVDADQRLTWRGRDLVGLAPPGWATTKIREATYCVVDLETTGGAPGKSKITEIGAVRVRGGEILERFTTLVNPGHEIPPPIMRITGIRNEMLVGQPRIDEVMERFVEFVGDDVMVAHNAPFDLRFLNFERHRISGQYFTQPWLDTLILARRLLRHRVERFDLSSLAAWANTDIQPNHRALPDAEATGELLSRLIELMVDRGITTLERAVAFGQTGGARHSHKLSLADNLPQRPGIYLMRDRAGAVLYIGKARNLRRRVRSYFGPQGKHGRLIARALDAVAQIDHVEAPSELTALLNETRLIREHKPPCNTQGVRTATRFLKLTINDSVPRLFVVADVLDDGAQYFGPIRSDRTARLAVAALHAVYPVQTKSRASQPGQQGLLGDEPVDHDERRQEGREAAVAVSALLSSGPGDAAAALMDLLAVRPALAQRIASAEGREAFEALLVVVATLGRVRAASAVCGVVAEQTSEGVHATFVAAGRVVAAFDLMQSTAGDMARAVTSIVAARGSATQPLGGADLDEAVVLHDWMRGRADQPGVIAIGPSSSVEGVLDELAHMLLTCTPQDLPDATVIVDAA